MKFVTGISVHHIFASLYSLCDRAPPVSDSIWDLFSHHLSSKSKLSCFPDKMISQQGTGAFARQRPILLVYIYDFSQLRWSDTIQLLVYLSSHANQPIQSRHSWLCPEKRTSLKFSNPSKWRGFSLARKKSYISNVAINPPDVLPIEHRDLHLAIRISWISGPHSFWKHVVMAGEACNKEKLQVEQLTGQIADRSKVHAEEIERWTGVFCWAIVRYD